MKRAISWAASLSNTKAGEFVIGDIAVREDLRGCDIGTLLIQTALKRISEMGGERIYLVAKGAEVLREIQFI